MDYTKAFDCVITTNCGKFKRWEYQTILPASWEICMQVKKQWLELDMEQQDWFQIGKGVCQGWILSPCLFNFYAEYIMQNAGLDEAHIGLKIARRSISNLRYAEDTTLWQNMKRNWRTSLWKWKRNEKAVLKLNIQKLRSWHPVQSLHGK